MNIKLDNVGKRFERNWIFRNLNLNFVQGKRYVVLGANGSGKSTLLKITSGNLTPTEGTLEYSNSKGNIAIDEVYKNVSIAAPYLDVPEEYSLHELLAFHKVFKPIENNLSEKDIIDVLELSHTKEKMYKHFSSGMKQRVKLGLAILSATPLLLLDEPATALDAKSVLWYQNMIKNYTKDKTIIVFSNNKEEEFSFCEEKMTIGN
ncbi:MAG TPA: ABC transporter ATP-binding protein [Bacteroidia bacterium]|jgi:ABC-type multidrug transport system ATPase subunit|nr:ABC transporter ATP-binding protein [Bacteroidia bacterium]